MNPKIALSLALASSLAGSLPGAPAGSDPPAPAVVAGSLFPETLEGQSLRPLSLASADFDGDGIADLAAGFASGETGVAILFRGNVDALYPNSPEARQRRIEGRFVASPFLSTDRVRTLAAPPDFLLAGDFDGDGRPDLAAASRGESFVDIHPGDGAGGFGEARRLALPGRLTALVAGDVGRRDGLPDLVGAIETAAGMRAILFQASEGALRATGLTVALEERAEAIEIVAGERGNAIRFVSDSGRVDRLERAARAWSVRREDEAAQKAAPAPEADVAASLAVRVDSRARERVVLRRDGTLGLAAPAVAATFVVGVTTSLPDASPGDGICAAANGDCSLRAAIEESNALPGADTITFAIPGPGVPSIAVGSLPTVTDTVTIDGTTQAAGRVAVTGTSNGFLLTIAANDCVVRGMVFNGTANVGLRLQSDGNVIEGSFFGTTDDGTAPQGGLAVLAIQIQSGNDDRIGGTAPLARNVVTGPSGAIRVDAGSGHAIEGNLIGVDVTGTVGIAGTAAGVRVLGGSAAVGGTAPGAGNVVSGFGQAGVRLDTPGSVVQGNRIGTDAAGLAAISNTIGVDCNFNEDVTIGGASPGAGNLVSGNAGDGIRLTQNLPAEMAIQGNRIGTDAAGAFAIPNEGYGLHIVGASEAQIGGTSETARNVISGNLLDGIFITKFITVAATGNVIQGNYIGTDATGTRAVPNLKSGIALEYAEATQIGGTGPGEGNVISGNFLHGIDLALTANAMKNLIYGNRIGANAFGNGPVGNGLAGIHIPLNTHGALIGGTGAGQANTIAFNSGAGVASSAGRALHVAPNVFHSNGGLGLDLFDDGVTANRPGATNNFPVVTLASDIGGGTSVAGDLDAKAATTFDVHVFSSLSCDPSGHGEGREYHKTIPVTTDAGGHGAFSTTITPAIPGGRYVTAYAVASGPADDTSEFSFCRQVQGGPPPEDVALELFAVAPPHGGNTGPVTIQISGQGIVGGGTARLERTGSPDRVATEVSVSADGSTLTATFDLTGAAEGPWDVTVAIPGHTATLPEAFTVEAGTAPEMWADILGRGTLVVRGGREQSFFVVFGNRGNVDSPPALLKVSIPWQLRVTAVEPAGGSARVVSIDSPVTTGGSGRSTIWIFAPSVPAESTTPVAFRVITIAALPGEFGQAVEMSVEWTSAAQLQSLFDIPSDPTVGETADVLVNLPAHFEATIHLSGDPGSADLHFDMTMTEVPYESDGVHRVLAVGGQVEHRYTIAFAAAPDESPVLYEVLLEGPETAFALARDGASVLQARRKETQEAEEIALLQNESLLDAARATGLNDLNAFATALDAVAAALVGVLPPGLVAGPTGDDIFGIRFIEMRKRVNGDVQKKLYDDYLSDAPGWNLKLFGGDVPGYDVRKPRSQKEIVDKVLDLWDGDGADHGVANDILTVYLAIDPNEKAGPSGPKAQRWIKGESPLPYTITFENLETATAAAQEVVVTDQLDGTKLDLSTFELGPITFGTRVVPVPPGLTSFTGDVDLRPGIDLIARVSADFNASTGLATWHFFSLDPATGLQTGDPALGFLPPNVGSPGGEGHISFIVQARTGLASGTEIHNQASIVFDANPAIVTADWFNTIDVTAPASQVAPIATACSEFGVSWSGADAHSGVASYDILVSENGGPFAPWLTATTATSAVFFGDVGKSYGFASVARDAAGNVEAPGGADASTTVSETTPLVDALEPDSGPATGQDVTVAGSGFAAGVSILVGGEAAGSVVVNDPTSLDAVFPALAPGALYDVAAASASACTDTRSKLWFADFLDVDQAHPFHDFVEKIVRSGVTAGCSGGNYCVDNAVTRAQMAVFMTKAKYRLSLVPAPASGTLFADVPPGSFAADFIEQIAKEGVTGGCGSGNYCPSNAVTRRQMAVFLLKSKHGALFVPPPATGVFTDVPAADTFAPWIEELAAEGITGGCGANTYCPDNPVTRGQMAVFLAKTFGF